MRVAIVIPAYNEADTIYSVVREASVYGQPIVVDDCSTDDTKAQAVKAGADVVRLDTNRGYDAALQKGFERACEMGFEAVATLDADGQHVATVLGNLLEPIIVGRADLVIGVRPRFSRFAEAAFGFYTKLRFGVPDILCGMKAYNMSLYQEYGCFDKTRSTGTELALYALRFRKPFEKLNVPVRERKGNSRFGSALRGNFKILRSMQLAVFEDLKYALWC